VDWRLVREPDGMDKLTSCELLPVVVLVLDSPVRVAEVADLAPKDGWRPIVGHELTAYSGADGEFR